MIFARFGFVWLIIELLVFYLVAKLVGILLAILLIVLSMLVGGTLMRWQGLDVLRRAREKYQRGETLETAGIESAAVVLGGVLMVIPGFVTTVLGLILLLPFCRIPLVKWLLSKSTPRSRGQGRTIDSEGWRDLEP